MSALPDEIERALGTLPGRMRDLGYTATADPPSPAFGDFLVHFSKPGHSLTISRDRSHFIVAGDRAELEPAGLWRAFGSIPDLESVLLPWLKERK